MLRHQYKIFWIYGDDKQLVPVKSSKVNFLKQIAYDFIVIKQYFRKNVKK